MVLLERALYKFSMAGVLFMWEAPPNDLYGFRETVVSEERLL